MALLKDKDREKLTELLKTLPEAVTLVMFTQEMECQYCEMTRKLLEEVTALSDRLTLEVYDFVKDKDAVSSHGIDKVPATIVMGDRDYGVRFYGVPSGYEFTTLIQDVMDAGRRSPGLSENILSGLRDVDRPVHLQVIISPT
ncbi:MAG: thioredoxin family protein [Deltaproteobacteria bacterium]|nr:thioredoxin family protein [Deltaproteobacteria bacterium]